MCFEEFNKCCKPLHCMARQLYHPVSVFIARPIFKHVIKLDSIMYLISLLSFVN